MNWQENKISGEKNKKKLIIDQIWCIPRAAWKGGRGNTEVWSSGILQSQILAGWKVPDDHQGKISPESSQTLHTPWYQTQFHRESPRSLQGFISLIQTKFRLSKTLQESQQSRRQSSCLARCKQGDSSRGR